MANPFFDIVPQGVFEAELADDQIGAIRFSLRLGCEIQERYPQIAEDYRNGLSISQIEEKYNMAKVFDANQKTVQCAISNAIRGYDGHLNLAKEEVAYPGLITDREELQRLGQEHNSESARILSKQRKIEGTGIFGITKEQRSEIGKRSGRKNYENKTGFFAMTLEQKRKAIQKTLISQGVTPYSDEELLYIQSLAADPVYQRRSRVNAMKIAKEVNRNFHDGQEVRTPRSITKIFNRLSSGERTI